MFTVYNQYENNINVYVLYQRKRVRFKIRARILRTCIIQVSIIIILLLYMFKIVHRKRFEQDDGLMIVYTIIQYRYIHIRIFIQFFTAAARQHTHPKILQNCSPKYVQCVKVISKRVLYNNLFPKNDFRLYTDLRS